MAGSPWRVSLNLGRAASRAVVELAGVGVAGAAVAGAAAVAAAERHASNLTPLRRGRERPPELSRWLSMVDKKCVFTYCFEHRHLRRGARSFSASGGLSAVGTCDCDLLLVLDKLAVLHTSFTSSRDCELSLSVTVRDEKVNKCWG